MSAYLILQCVIIFSVSIVSADTNCTKFDSRLDLTPCSAFIASAMDGISIKCTDKCAAQFSKFLSSCQMQAYGPGQIYFIKDLAGKCAEARSTQAPTSGPTFVPTSMPTDTPTNTPTELPTGEPTLTPTELPTPRLKTLSPSGAPTEVPTHAPTYAPSEKPTAEPTEAPTITPSDATQPPTDCPPRAKLSLFFKKASDSQIDSVVSLMQQEARTNEHSDAQMEKERQTLEAQTATALSIEQKRLIVTRNAARGAAFQVQILVHGMDSIKLGHDLEKKILTKTFNPLPDYIISRMYMEEIFICDEHVPLIPLLPPGLIDTPVPVISTGTPIRETTPPTDEPFLLETPSPEVLEVTPAPVAPPPVLTFVPLGKPNANDTAAPTTTQCVHTPPAVSGSLTWTSCFNAFKACLYANTNDELCAAQRKCCERSAPYPCRICSSTGDGETAAPTHDPTQIPTMKYTPQPPLTMNTPAPTHTPTHTPSKATTAPVPLPPVLTPEPSEQTEAPTDTTAQPSAKPSEAPTDIPTTMPPTTDKPSFAPTSTPTEDPTSTPTGTPTFAPSPVSTEYPTWVPTQPSTFDPTSNPTHTPTDQPTTLPPTTTDIPSSVPTRTPTHVPTPAPTFNPTFLPTYIPSHTPTEAPTEPPTDVPSRVPTDPPTTLPPTSNKPSFAPSATPTHLPTRQPTGTPTEQPSGVPTMTPIDKSCNKHGMYHAASDSCLCDPGYVGYYCEHKCPKGKNGDFCSGKGWCGYDPIADAPQCVCYKDSTVGQDCPGGSEPPKCPKDCKYGGVCALSGHNMTMEQRMCICENLYTGPDCSIPKAPGWDISRPRTCNGRPVSCTTANCQPPMQQWTRIKLGKEDHLSVFYPFKKSKLAWFRKIKVVLDQPMGQGGSSLLGLNVVGSLSAWVEFPSGFVFRAAILGSFSMPFHPGRRRLLEALEEGTMDETDFHSLLSNSEAEVRPHMPNAEPRTAPSIEEVQQQQMIGADSQRTYTYGGRPGYGGVSRDTGYNGRRYVPKAPAPTKFDASTGRTWVRRGGGWDTMNVHTHSPHSHSPHSHSPHSHHTHNPHSHHTHNPHSHHTHNPHSHNPHSHHKHHRHSAPPPAVITSENPPPVSHTHTPHSHSPHSHEHSHTPHVHTPPPPEEPVPVPTPSKPLPKPDDPPPPPSTPPPEDPVSEKPKGVIPGGDDGEDKPKAPAVTKSPSIFDLFSFALRFDLPRGVRIADFFPWMSGSGKQELLQAGYSISEIQEHLDMTGADCTSMLDKFNLARLAVYFATGPLTDVDLAMIPGDAYTGVEIDRGITLLGEINVNNAGGLRNVQGLFKQVIFQTYVTFLPLTPSWILSFGVATTLPKPFLGIVGKLQLDYKSILDPRYVAGGSGFFLSLRLRIGWMMGGDQVQFQAIVSVGFMPEFAAPLMMPLRAEADLIGCIPKMFGISGLSICDLGLGFGIDLVRLQAALAATAASGGLGAPALFAAFDYFRIQGGIVLGEGAHAKKFIMLIKIDLSNPINNAFIGAMKGNLCLIDLINFPIGLARKAGMKIPLVPNPKFPIACIENPTLKVSAMPILIAGEQFDAGIAIRGNITFFGVKFGIDISIGLIHVKVKGFCDKFKFGPMQLGGHGCDMRAGTSDDGLCLDISFQVYPKQEAYIRFTGSFSLFGLFKVEAHANLDVSGLYLKFAYQLGIFGVEYEVWTNNMKEIIQNEVGTRGSNLVCNGKSVTLNPAYSACKASSVWKNQKLGTGCGEGRLGSSRAWCAAKNAKGEWWQIDAGSIKPIVGVRTEGRKDVDQRVTKIKVLTSKDGKAFTPVDSGKVFDANLLNSSLVNVTFSRPVDARYVRIIAEAWHKHVSMRAALIEGKDCFAKTKTLHEKLRGKEEEEEDTEMFIDETGAKKYKNDFHVKIAFKQDALDWLAKTIDSGVEAYKKMMDNTIKAANSEISGAASKVRKSCGSGEQEQMEMMQMSESEQAEIVDESIRRIRRRALEPSELALIDDSAPIKMTGEELQELVRRADERDAAEGKPKYTLYTEEEMRGLEQQIFNPDSNLDEIEVDLQAQARWGRVGKWAKKTAKSAVKVVRKVGKTVVKVATHVGKTVVKGVVKAAKAVGKVVVKVGKAIGDGIAKAAKAVWSGLKAAAKWVAKVVCDAVAGFLDTVVKGLVRGFLEMGKWIVYVGGKMIAKVLKSAFNVRLIQYQGSAQRLIRADFGTLKVDATVLGLDIKFELRMALLSALGIKGRRLLAPVTQDATEEIEEKRPDEQNTKNGNHESKPTQIEDLAVSNGDKWGGGRRRRRWHVHHRHRPHIHIPHRHHIHIPHRHHIHVPHLHVPHRHHIHVPHLHVPHRHHIHVPHKHHKHHRHHSHHKHHRHHRHNPHHHTASPTGTPSISPTRLPTVAPRPRATPRPTNAPTAEAKTDGGRTGTRIEDGLKKQSCKVLDKMGFGRSCSGGAPVQKVDAAAAEQKLIDQFYIKHGSRVMLVTSHSTFIKTERGSGLSSKGKSEDLSSVYEVHVPGGGNAHFGMHIALKNMCSGKFLGAEHGLLKADRNSMANGAAQFQLFNAENFSDHGGIKDFAFVTMKAYDGRWLGAKNTGEVTMDRESVANDEKIRLMKMPHNGFAKGSC